MFEVPEMLGPNLHHSSPEPSCDFALQSTALVWSFWLPLDSYSTRPFLISIDSICFHEWDMLLIHQACLRHQAEKNMAETCWKTLAACFLLALLAKVQKAFIFGRLLQARVDNHSRNLGMKKVTTRRFFKTRGSLQTGPGYPPIIPGSKRPSSWSRCQPPKWPCKKNNSSSKKLANVFVSSRLTWTTVFLIQIHPVQVQWNKIIDHWGEFPSSTTLDRGSRWRLL